MSSVSRNSGPKVKLPPCIDCGQEWEMFASEKKWWDSQVGNKTPDGSIFTFPKRCPSCREARRSNNPANISNDLLAIAKSVSECEFIGQEEELGRQLEDLAKRVSKLIKKPKQDASQAVAVA